jgi:hypothetical protein
LGKGQRGLSFGDKVEIFEMFLGAGVPADPAGFRNAVNLKRRKRR